MELKTCEKVCKECPFRKDSMKGWLGGFDVDEVLDAQQYEQLYSCHLHRGEDSAQNEKDIESGDIPICRGFLISAYLSCKVFGQHPQTGKSLRELQDSLVITEEEKSLILNRWNFRTHHKK